MDGTQFFSQQGLTDQNSLWHAVRFMQRQAEALSRTATPVKIIKVYNGGVGPPPTVDVLPLVNQIDGAGYKTPHVTLYGIPVLRAHGGGSAIIADPAAGDTGWVTVGDRDHSAVMRQAQQANPSSFRRGSLSDAVYTGALGLQVTPNQYLYFLPNGGLKLVDKFGNIIGFQNSTPNVYVKPAGDTSGKVYLGGDGTSGDFEKVVTTGGPSINVFARVS